MDEFFGKQNNGPLTNGEGAVVAVGSVEKIVVSY